MEREQLERTAVHYPYLRGLLALPLGFMLIMSGLGNMEWGPFRQEALFVGSVVLALAGYVLIARYYEKNYGTVTPKKGRRGSSWATSRPSWGLQVVR